MGKKHKSAFDYAAALAQAAVRLGQQQPAAYVNQQSVPVKPSPENAAPKEVDERYQDEDDEAEAAAQTYATYRPSRITEGGPHPDDIVETGSLASVQLPNVTYKHHIGDVVQKGSISGAQLETVVYAMRRFEECGELPDGSRPGFVLGDGAGVGKGRQIAALILEFWRRGGRRVLWVSVSHDLAFDARRDLDDVGAHDIEVYPKGSGELPKDRLSTHLKQGVLFATYSLLIAKGSAPPRPKKQKDPKPPGGRRARASGDKPTAATAAAAGAPGAVGGAGGLGGLFGAGSNDADGYEDPVAAAWEAQAAVAAERLDPGNLLYSSQTRLSRIIEWLKGHDKVLIVFDECHRAKNWRDGETTKTGTLTAQAVVALQRQLPRAHVLYSSATGATNPFDLSYMVRLPTCGFSTFQQLLASLKKSGLGALEMFAMGLKASGTYLCRTLSYSGAEFSMEQIDIAPEMRRMYDRAGEMWQLLFKVSTALEGKKTPGFWGNFWSSHQRFFRQMLMAAKIRACAARAQQSVSQGMCVVIGLQSTGEAMSRRVFDGAGGDSDDLGDLVSAPLVTLKRWIEDFFPVFMLEGPPPGALQTLVKQVHDVIEAWVRDANGGSSSGVGTSGGLVKPEPKVKPEAKVKSEAPAYARAAIRSAQAAATAAMAAAAAAKSKAPAAACAADGKDEIEFVEERDLDTVLEERRQLAIRTGNMLDLTEEVTEAQLEETFKKIEATEGKLRAQHAQHVQAQRLEAALTRARLDSASPSDTSGPSKQGGGRKAAGGPVPLDALEDDDDDFRTVRRTGTKRPCYVEDSDDEDDDFPLARGSKRGCKRLALGSRSTGGSVPPTDSVGPSTTSGRPKRSAASRVTFRYSDGSDQSDLDDVTSPPAKVDPKTGRPAAAADLPTAKVIDLCSDSDDDFAAPNRKAAPRTLVLEDSDGGMPPPREPKQAPAKSASRLVSRKARTQQQQGPAPMDTDSDRPHAGRKSRSASMDDDDWASASEYEAESSDDGEEDDDFERPRKATAAADRRAASQALAAKLRKIKSDPATAAPVASAARAGGKMTRATAAQSGVDIDAAYKHAVKSKPLDSDWEDEADELGEAQGAGGPADPLLVKIKGMLLRLAESLELPPNPLDQLIALLGGDDKIAELTGRKARLVCESDGAVRQQKRAGNGIAEKNVNMAEKTAFMNGDKLIAIISDAASTGISLQADKRFRNQRRRNHITLELAWSADKAIQQFGRSHRANQASAPLYSLLVTQCSGEYRFASAVAKRLQTMGALLHGNRRAVGAGTSLRAFDVDNKHGHQALKRVYSDICEDTQPLPGVEIPELPLEWRVATHGTPNPPPQTAQEFLQHMQECLFSVGLVEKRTRSNSFAPMPKGYRMAGNKASDVARFLNRMLGLSMDNQRLLFSYFSNTLEAVVMAAKAAGNFDDGIITFGCKSVTVASREVIHTDLRSGAETYKVTLDADWGLSFEEALAIRNDRLEVVRQQRQVAAPRNHRTLRGAYCGFYRDNRSTNWGDTGHSVVCLITPLPQRAGDTQEMVRIQRPTNYKGTIKTRAEMDNLSIYTPCRDDDMARDNWTFWHKYLLKGCGHGEHCAVKKRGDRCTHMQRMTKEVLITGACLPVWKILYDTVERSGSLDEEQLEGDLGIQYKKKHGIRVYRATTTNAGDIIGLKMLPRVVESFLNKIQEDGHGPPPPEV